MTIFVRLLVLLGLQALFFAPLQAQNWEWAKRGGGIFEEQTRGVALDAAGNTYITGFFVNQTNWGTGTITAYGGAGADIYIAKYNPAGTLLWMQRAGSRHDDFAYDIVADAAGNVFVTGSFQDTAAFGSVTAISAGASDIFVAKYSTSGAVQWVQRFGGASNDFSYSIALDPSGNMFIAGSFQNSTVFGTNTFTSAGSTDAFVAKLGSTGNVLWVKQGGGAVNDQAYKVTSDASGNCLVTGSFWTTATFDALTLSSSGNADMFVAKYNAAGAIQWAKKAGGIQEDNGYGLATDNSGNVFVSGYFRSTATFEGTSLTTTGNYEAYTVKYSPAGVMEWVRQAGGTGYDNAWAVDTDNSGNAYVAGYYQGTATFGSHSVTATSDRDLFVVKYNAAGVAQWVRGAGGAMFDNAYAIATDGAGNSFVTGFINATATFGLHTLSTAGSYDSFLARLANCPTVIANAGPDIAACSGSPATIGAAAQSGLQYSWSVSPAIAGFSSTSGSPVVTMPAVTTPTDYTFTLTTTITGMPGCFSTDQVTVTVNPAPATSLVASATNICPGGQVQLSASGAAAYSWQPATGLSATTGPVVTATPNLTTTYSVLGTNPGCPANIQAVTITVAPMPATPVAAASPACIGQNLALTASAVPNSTYSWVGPGGFASADQNPVINNVTAAVSGTYSVFAVSADGCVSQAGIVSVSAQPVPSATTAVNSGPVCAGQPLSLSAAPVASAQFTWSGPGGFFSTVQNPAIGNSSTAATGNYSVTVTVNGCTSAPAVTNAIVNYTPAITTISSNGPVCFGSDILLTTDAGAGASYSWTGPASFSSSDQNPVRPNANASLEGTYSVFATSGSCTSAAGTVFVAVLNQPVPPVVSVNSPVCEGSPVVFTNTAVAGATYSWAGPGGFSSSAASPVISTATAADSGMYTVYSLATGCVPASATVYVEIRPTPATPAVTDTIKLCEGDDFLHGVTPVPGNAYTWTGPGNFIQTLPDLFLTSVTIQQGGAYSLVATANGCASVPGVLNLIISTKPAQPVITTNSPVCEGDTLKFSATSTPGATYTWHDFDSFTSYSQSNIIPNAATSFTDIFWVTANLNGCGSEATHQSLEVVPAPVVTVAASDTILCTGDMVTLSATGGIVYSWLADSMFTGVTGPVVSASPASATTYTVFGSNGTCSVAASVFVDVVSAPALTIIAGNDSLLPGSATQLLAVASGIGPYSYSWYPATALSSTTIANPVASPGSSATYSVLVTDQGSGCAATAGISIIVLSSDKELAVAGPSLNAMPNPSGGEFTAAFTLASDQEVTLSVTDVLGRIITTSKVKGSKGQNSVHYNLNGKCSDGVYLLILQAENTLLTERIVKAR